LSAEDYGEKVDRVEKELENLKSSVKRNVDELKKAISDLKNSIVEIRTAISEIENPFNLLKAVTGEEGLPERLREPLREPERETEEVLKEAKREEEAVSVPRPGKPPVSFKTAFSLVKWICALLDMGFDENDVKNISNYCEFFGLLPERSSGCISDLSLTVNKARALGLDGSVLALSMYGAAKASGLKFELEEITDMVFNTLMKLYRRGG